MVNEKFLISLDPERVTEMLGEFRTLSEEVLTRRFDSMVQEWTTDEGRDPRSSVFLGILVCDHVLQERKDGMV